MTQVTIDLDRLRATMPKHPTWPTPGDTTDPKEADAVFASLTEGWILGAQAGDQPLSTADCGDPERRDCFVSVMRRPLTGLCDPESDNDGQHGTTTPPEPETDTQRPSWPDVLDHLDEAIRQYRSGRVLYGDFVDEPEVPALIFDAYRRGLTYSMEDKTLGRPNQLYKGVRIFRADDGPPWPPPTPDMHESELAGPAGPDCITTDCRDCPDDCEYTVARLWAWEQLAK